MTVVVDSSAVMAALVDGGSDGEWARAELDRTRLAAPHLMPVEVANILRRTVHAGLVTADAGALAHADLVLLRVEFFPYEPFADRVWQLRDNLTAHDAWYVALAEVLSADLVTLDARIARAPGLRCSVRLPSS
jgi:predicted nucleic acid-binding protein